MKRLAAVALAGVVLFLGLPVAVLMAGGAGLAGTSAPDCAAPGGKDMAAIGLTIGVRLGASERVLTAALAAGLVESGLRNLANDGQRGPEDTAASDADLAVAAQSLALPHDGVGSDNDSVGVLQQRNHWGSPAQRLDPAYAFAEFYKRAIPLDQAGWTGSPGSLAQAVQVSAFPDRYDQALPDALTLLAQLRPGLPADTCQPLDPSATASPVPAGYGTPGPCGLSPSTHYTRELIVKTFGIANIGGCAPGSGHISGSYHYPDANGQAHALDVMVGANKALGDKVAGWAVANAKALNIVEVIFYGDIWTPGSGWHPCRPPGSSCAVNHNDHPHLSFRRGT